MTKYNAESIQVLDAMTAIRKRPGMYIGGTDKTALHHCVLEVVSNSIDEFMSGYGAKIRVEVLDGMISIRDYGRGIPFGKMKNGREALTAIFTETHSGAKFDDNGYKVAGGLHGVGLTAVNAVSQVLTAYSYRDGKLAVQAFERGIPRFDIQIKNTEQPNGTRVEFLQDPEIFGDLKFDYDFICSQVKELSYLTTGLSFEVAYMDEFGEELEVRKYEPQNGLLDYIQDFTKDDNQIFNKPFYYKGRYNDIDTELVFTFVEARNEKMKIYTNNIPNEAGTHVTGFRSAFTSFINSYSNNNDMWDGQNFSGDLVRKGLRIIASVKMKDPMFVGQTKEKLSSPEARSAVSNVVTEAMEEFAVTRKKDLHRIIADIVQSLNKDTTSQQIKAITKKSPILGNTILPGKLADCNKRGVTAEIFIVEGSSAAGSMKSARNRDNQAILPLRGKILNAEKNTLEKLLKNKEIQSLIKAFGIGIGDLVDISKIRYGKIILATDADIDGAHIRTLLLTFLYKYMRELLEEGFIYAAVPPLFQITYGKTIRYAYEEEEMQEIVDNHAAAVVSRFKGLGEMSDKELWETTMNPENRTLFQITIEDAAKAANIFEVLMGTKVVPRRNFIIEHSELADLDV